MDAIAAGKQDIITGAQHIDAPAYVVEQGFDFQTGKGERDAATPADHAGQLILLLAAAGDQNAFPCQPGTGFCLVHGRDAARKNRGCQ